MRASHAFTGMCEEAAFAYRRVDDAPAPGAVAASWSVRIGGWEPPGQGLPRMEAQRNRQRVEDHEVVLLHHGIPHSVTTDIAPGGWYVPPQVRANGAQIHDVGREVLFDGHAHELTVLIVPGAVVAQRSFEVEELGVLWRWIAHGVFTIAKAVITGAPP